MNKVASKTRMQLKHFLILPFLLGMMFCVSCATGNENKQKTTIYLGFLKGKQVKANKYTYMDVLQGLIAPTTKEYSVSELTKEERIEFDLAKEEALNEVAYDANLRVFQGENNRKVIFYNMKKAVKFYRDYDTSLKKSE